MGPATLARRGREEVPVKLPPHVRVPKRRPGRPRKDASNKPSHELILEAAEALFAREGFGNASLRRLMEVSGMSTSAFYARFKSKDAVLAALVERLMISIGEALVATMPRATDILAGFDVGIDELVAALVRHRAVARVALGEGAASEPVRDQLLSGFTLLHSLMEEGLRRLSAKGRARIVDRRALAWALVGSFQIHIERWAVFSAIDDEGLRSELRAIVRTLLPAIRPPAPPG